MTKPSCGRGHKGLPTCTMTINADGSHSIPADFYIKFCAGLINRAIAQKQPIEITLTAQNVDDAGNMSDDLSLETPLTTTETMTISKSGIVTYPVDFYRKFMSSMIQKAKHSGDLLVYFGSKPASEKGINIPKPKPYGAPTQDNILEIITNNPDIGLAELKDCFSTLFGFDNDLRVVASKKCITANAAGTGFIATGRGIDD